MNRIEIPDWSWLPRASSTLAAQLDQAWYVVTVVCAIFALIVYGVMAYTMVKYRRRGPDDVVSKIDHNFRIEVIWTVIPTIVVIGLFWVGIQGYMDVAVAPGNSIEIRGTGAKWLWTFTQPTGYVESGELHIPKGRPVKVTLSARDVIHSFYIPEFRVKHDAIPGAYTTVWFEATRTGETVLECTEYCGTGHSDMLAKVHILEPADYEKWLEDVSNEGKKYKTPALYGEALFTKNACATCHSVDGRVGAPFVAPTLKGAFGRTEALEGGRSVVIDDNYIRRSILTPQADVVKGFNPVMPTFQGVLKDEQIDALIAYIKTLK